LKRDLEVTHAQLEKEKAAAPHVNTKIACESTCMRKRGVPLSSHDGGADEAPEEETRSRRLVSLEEGMPAPSGFQTRVSSRLSGRGRTRRRTAWRALAISLGACVIGATCSARASAWERKLVEDITTKHDICSSGKLFQAHVRVLGFADADLPVMYLPTFVSPGLAAPPAKKLRSVEVSDLCPKSSSKMRFESIDVTYRARPWFAKRHQTLRGLSAACVQHVADAWVGVC
jgi:hypothetical protein